MDIFNQLGVNTQSIVQAIMIAVIGLVLIIALQSEMQD